MKLVAVTPPAVNVIVYQTALSHGSAIVTVNECVSPVNDFTIPGLSAMATELVIVHTTAASAARVVASITMTPVAD